MLHARICCGEPLHVGPPIDGAGLSQALIRFCTPIPHIREHVVYGLQAPQFPATGCGAGLITAPFVTGSGKKKEEMGVCISRYRLAGTGTPAPALRNSGTT